MTRLGGGTIKTRDAEISYIVLAYHSATVTVSLYTLVEFTHGNGCSATSATTLGKLLWRPNDV